VHHPQQQAFTGGRLPGLHHSPSYRADAAPLIFIVIGPESPWTVRRLYRQRFGEETSYRCAGQVQGWIAQCGLPIRAWGPELFYGGRGGASVWVLHAGITSRWFDRERFRLRRYAAFILQALRERYGYVQQRVASAPPLP